MIEKHVICPHVNGVAGAIGLHHNGAAMRSVPFIWSSGFNALRGPCEE
jgi:hypothetical protein